MPETPAAPPRLDCTLVELHMGPAIDTKNFPISLGIVQDAFQSVELMQRYANAQKQSKEVNLRLKNIGTEIGRLKRAIDEREDEVRMDPTLTEQLAGKNDTERKAKLTNVLKKDAIYRELNAELHKLEDERNTVSSELEGLQGDVKMFADFCSLSGSLLQASAVAMAVPQAAAAYLS